MMCRDMAEELAHFDLQKEKELKQVLLEYTAAQLERHEKVRRPEGEDLSNCWVCTRVCEREIMVLFASHTVPSYLL